MAEKYIQTGRTTLIRERGERYARAAPIPKRGRRSTKRSRPYPFRPHNRFAYERLSIHCRCMPATAPYARVWRRAEPLDARWAPIAYVMLVLMKCYSICPHLCELRMRVVGVIERGYTNRPAQPSWPPHPSNSRRSSPPGMRSGRAPPSATWDTSPQST